MSETVLPVFKTLLQQYADQHSRTKKDLASLRSAWTCISSVAPYIPPQAVLESSGSAMLPPALSLPDAALDAVSDVVSGNSELENSQLVSFNSTLQAARFEISDRFDHSIQGPKRRRVVSFFSICFTVTFTVHGIR